jgi:hypothetical protein
MVISEISDAEAGGSRLCFAFSVARAFRPWGFGSSCHGRVRSEGTSSLKG